MLCCYGYIKRKGLPTLHPDRRSGSTSAEDDLRVAGSIRQVQCSELGASRFVKFSSESVHDASPTLTTTTTTRIHTPQSHPLHCARRAARIVRFMFSDIRSETAPSEPRTAPRDGGTTDGRRHRTRRCAGTPSRCCCRRCTAVSRPQLSHEGPTRTAHREIFSMQEILAQIFLRPFFPRPFLRRSSLYSIDNRYSTWCMLRNATFFSPPASPVPARWQ